jgi:predicted nucleic acid-binding protein
VSYVLDTTVLVDVLREDPGAFAFLDGIDEPVFASEISRVEAIRGLRSRERASADAWFDLIRWHPVDETIARVAGEFGRRLRRSHQGVGVADLVVAATADVLGLPLATSNTKHFPMFKGLKAPY